MTSMRLPVAALVLALASQVAIADPNVASGVITQISTFTAAGGGPNNGDLRVFIAGQTFCSGPTTTTWSFINASDANYKGVVGALMLAYSMGKQVAITSTVGTISGVQYCQIARVDVIG